MGALSQMGEETQKALGPEMHKGSARPFTLVIQLCGTDIGIPTDEVTRPIPLGALR